VTSPALRRARVAVLGFFFVLGVATATWSARLPAIKEALHLSDGRLGLALFAVPAGAVATLPVSGRIADRFGATRVTRIAGAACPAALIPIGLGPQTRSLAVLVAALALYGAMAGLLDVSMNACGAKLELAYGRPILSSLHAGYSIAGLAGAGIGGLSAALDVSPLPTFALTAAVLIIGGLVLGPWLVIPPPVAEPGHGSANAMLRTAAQITLVIWVLGVLALCGQVGEGAAGDWSAVYLHVNLGTSAGTAAAGLAAFSVMMAAGRVAGDRLAARFGSVRLVRASGLVAGLGLAGGLLIPSPAAAIAGFALLGAGQAGIFPQIVSSAVRLDPSRAGRNIGRIAAVAYSGLLGGPVAIGAAASGIGLRNALLIPAALSVLVATAAGLLAWSGKTPPPPQQLALRPTRPRRQPGRLGQPPLQPQHRDSRRQRHPRRHPERRARRHAEQRRPAGRRGRQPDPEAQPDHRHVPAAQAGRGELGYQRRQRRGVQALAHARRDHRHDQDRDGDRPAGRRHLHQQAGAAEQPSSQRHGQRPPPALGEPGHRDLGHHHGHRVGQQ
jgi:MFS family permease